MTLERLHALLSKTYEMQLLMPYGDQEISALQSSLIRQYALGE
jgi:hypothetical protein